MGSSEAHISLTINSRDNLFGWEVYIPNNKELYAKLFEQKEAIEQELGENPEWMELPEKKASRIKVSTSGDFNKIKDWEDYFEWMLRKAEKFQAVFPRYLRG